MRGNWLSSAFCAAALLPALAWAEDWVPIDPENLLYLDLAHGTAIIELQPTIAPATVARIKKLTRAGFYNGLTFHRVIDGFMAQGGDPAGTGEGGSKEPDLVAEFTFHRAPSAPAFAQSNAAESIGVSGGAIVLTEPETAQYTHPDGMLQSWMPFCRGVAAMARTDQPNTANSQFFIMFSNNYRNLDRAYTAWGRVVLGMDAVDNLARGEPPGHPDKIIRARIGSDVPPAERKALEEPAPGSQTMRDIFKAASNAQADPCSVQVPVRAQGGGH